MMIKKLFFFKKKKTQTYQSSPSYTEATIKLITPPPLSKQEKLEAEDDELEIFYPMIVEW